jgi:hypothetical protein
MKLTGENRTTWGKTCPSATLSTTNPTWTDRCERAEPWHGLSSYVTSYCNMTRFLQHALFAGTRVETVARESVSPFRFAPEPLSRSTCRN